MLLQAASTRQIPAVMHPVAAVKQRAFMMVAYFGYLVAAFANVPPPGGVALGPVFAGRRIHHPDNDCPSSSATTEADSPAVPHVFVSAAQPYRNGSETMAAFGRKPPLTKRSSLIATQLSPNSASTLRPTRQPLDPYRHATFAVTACPRAKAPVLGSKN